MSYVNDQAQFALAGGIQELTLEEISEVDGAADSRVLATAATIAGSAVLLSSVPPVAGALMTAATLVAIVGLVS